MVVVVGRRRRPKIRKRTLHTIDRFRNTKQLQEAIVCAGTRRYPSRRLGDFADGGKNQSLKGSSKSRSIAEKTRTESEDIAEVAVLPVREIQKFLRMDDSQIGHQKCEGGRGPLEPLRRPSCLRG